MIQNFIIFEYRIKTITKLYSWHVILFAFDALTKSKSSILKHYRAVL